ncbi:hypothetical protein D3C80_2003720 [compost metagenome]
MQGDLALNHRGGLARVKIAHRFAFGKGILHRDRDRLTIPALAGAGHGGDGFFRFGLQAELQGGCAAAGVDPHLIIAIAK